jgi:hypothetical protein
MPKKDRRIAVHAIQATGVKGVFGRASGELE